MAATVGYMEKSCIDELQEHIGWELDRQVNLSGHYVLDAYSHELNMAIEVDEKYHDNVIQKAKDDAREKIIHDYLLPGVVFFRMRIDDWKHSKSKEIQRFKDQVDKCQFIK